MKKNIIYVSTLALGATLLASCGNSSYQFADKLYVPQENIKIENNQLGYVYPKAGSTDNAKFYIDYTNGENYPVIREHYYTAQADYGEINKAGGIPLTYDITIYPTDLSKLSLSIKPVSSDSDSKTEIGKNGEINIYNNSKVFATLAYTTDMDVKLSYKDLEKYIKDNFTVLKDYSYSNTETDTYVVSNQESSLFNSVNINDFSCSGIEKYKLTSTFKENDNTFFNNPTLNSNKYYYIESLGYENNKDYSFNMKLSLKNYKTLDYSKLTYAIDTTHNETNKLYVSIKVDNVEVGYALFESSLNLTDVYESFLNAHFNK